MLHAPYHNLLLRRLMLRVVEPAGGSALLALGVWSGWAGALLTLISVIAIGITYQLRQQLFAAANPPGTLAAAEHPWHQQLLRLARRAGVDAPRLYLDPCWGTLAGTVGFVSGKTGIIVEGGVLRALSLTGAAGLLAHELGHVIFNHVRAALAERLVLQAASRTLQLAGFAFVFYLSPTVLIGAVAFMAAWLLPPHLVGVVEARRMQRKELAADRFAVDLVGAAATARGLSEFDSYVAAQYKWASTMARVQDQSLWARLGRSLQRSPDTAVLLAAMERLKSAEARARALVDQPPPLREELISHARRLEYLLDTLPMQRASTPLWQRIWPQTARPLRARWSQLSSDHPQTAERLAQIREEPPVR